MPDLWTHYFFAKQVKYEQQLKITQSDIYYLGAQGPDFLFYQAFEPWKKDKPGSDVGELFHQVKTDQLLPYVFEKRQTATGELADYLAGFLTHYALDSTVHPMIHRLAEDFRAHKELEMALDMKLYRERRSGQSIRSASVRGEIAKKRQLPEPIAQFYVDLARDVFETEIDLELFKESYRDFRRFHSWTSLSSPLKHRLIEQALKRYAPDYAFYFHGDYVAQLPIDDEVWEEYLDRFWQARQVFSSLNRSELPAEVVNFSGYTLEMKPAE